MTIESNTECKCLTPDADVAWLLTLVGQSPREGAIVEIGCYHGALTTRLATICRITGRKLFAVDPFSESHLGNMPKAERVFRDTVSNDADVLTFFKCNSDDCWKDITVPVSFVYVDGDHSYYGVLRDIRNAWSKLIPGGIVAIHDMDRSQINQAVADFAASQHKAGRYSYRHSEGCGLDWFIR